MSRLEYPEGFHEWFRDFIPGHTVWEAAQEAGSIFGDDFHMTEEQLRNYKARHNLRSGAGTRKRRIDPETKLFPPAVEEFMIAHNQGIFSDKLTELVNAEFGTDYKQTQVQCWRKRTGNRCGLSLTGLNLGRGKKNNCRPNITSYKPGDLPHNSVPIGTIHERDGYLYIKVKQGQKNGNWMSLSHYIWEKLNGPLPPKTVLCFRDGNPMNPSRDNMVPVTRAELRTMNTIAADVSSPEVFDAKLTLARIKSRRHRLKKERGNGNGKMG